MTTQKQIGPKYRVFTVKYVAPTNHRGSRVKITDELARESKTIDYDYSLNHVIDMAANHLESVGIEIVGHGELKDSYVIFSDSWSNGGEFKSVKGNK